MNQPLFGAAGQTSIHPAFLAIIAVGILLMFVLPRKYVLVPLLLLSISIPLGQVVMVGSFHFISFRILIIGALLRLLWQRYVIERESSIRLCGTDLAIVLYALVCLVSYTLLWQQTAAFIGILGKMYNVIGYYFVFRYFIRDQDDVERIIKVFVVLALVIAACMFNEQMTGRNFLAVFGGVAEATAVRGDYLRSQGPFRVYLTAGAFGATLLPLFFCLWRRGSRLFASLGLIGALTIAITSKTSTAIGAVLAVVLGLGMWVLRDRMRLVRWCVGCGALVLQLMMKAPVWALLARTDLVGGSTGWHRFKIIDNFVHHFPDWWLLGSTNYWTWEGGDDMWDQANQYVAIGENTGLLSLILFLEVIVLCFKYLGDARWAAHEDPRHAWFLWLFGVAVFSNLVAFLGISYFDQTFIVWYGLVAMIVALAGPGTRRVSMEGDEEAEELQLGFETLHAGSDQSESAWEPR